MKVICGWCQKLMEDGPPPVSHGCCDECVKLVLAQNDEANVKIQTACSSITPISNDVHQQFQTSSTAVLEASSLGWQPGRWPRHFYVLGIEGCFNFFRDVTGTLNETFLGKEYQDSVGHSIVVLND